MTAHTDESIQNYLAAIGQVHGAEYRDRMVVAFCGGHYYKVKHPHEDEGKIVPVGHLDLMTKNLLEHKSHP